METVTGGNQIFDGKVLIVSTPVEHIGVEEDSFAMLVVAVVVEGKINEPSCVDSCREDIRFTKTSICSESGANKHGCARCSSSNSFSLALSLDRRRAKIFDIF